MATFPTFQAPRSDRRDSAASTSSSIPAKRVKDMTPEERLASLKEWCEEQKYVQPGQGGTFGYGGFAGSRPVTYAGPVRFVEPAYQGYIAPPSYETAPPSYDETHAGSPDKAGPIKKWLRKRKGKSVA